MTIFSKTQTPTEQFEDAVRRELDLYARKRLTVEQLEQAQLSAGDAYLETGTSGPAVESVLRLQAELQAIDRASNTIRQRRAAALLAEFKTDAKKLRDEIATKERAVAEIEKRTAKILADLAEIEGVSYDASILFAQKVGDFQNGAPRSYILRQEIESLQARAKDLEERTVPVSGVFDAEGLTDDAQVIEGMLRVKAVTPTPEAVASWLSSIAQSVKPISFGSLPRRAYVRFTGGVIAEESHLFIPSLAKKRKTDFDGSRDYVTSQDFTSIIPESATFRAPKKPLTFEQQREWQAA